MNESMMAAAKLAEYIVQQARGKRGRHFSVLEDYGQPVPFLYHWKRKNCRGVTFPRGQGKEAEAWVMQALLAGYLVSYHIGARNGFVAGRSLKDGLPLD
jgi:hypothetical protein